MSVNHIDIYSRRSQEVVMVLYSLRALSSIHSKEEVLRFVREHRFYAIQHGDKASYESKREWKSDTLLCYARKDAVQEAWMFNHDEKDSWQIDRDGLKVLDEIIGRFRTKLWDVRKCFMWRPEFKSIIDPSYVQSSLDSPRPLQRRKRDIVSEALALLRHYTRSD
jgi:hypothetical protein